MSRKKGSARPTSSKSTHNTAGPGGIDAASWRQLSDTAGTQDVIAETINQVLSNVNSIILELEIDRTVKTSVVAEAVDAVRQVLEVNYLFKDPGESDLTDSCWQPDDECLPPPIDSWAPGAMPIITADELEQRERSNRNALLASRRPSTVTTQSSSIERKEMNPATNTTSQTPCDTAQTTNRAHTTGSAAPRPPRIAKSAGRTASARRAKSAGDRSTRVIKDKAPLRSSSAREGQKTQPLPPADKPASRSRRRPNSKPEFKGNTNTKVPAIQA
eukprot:m.115960 g.115960  ORF g.115960 m.115960 type:complete len:273 (+) comp15510_c0_seq1:100-918(+)